MKPRDTFVAYRDILAGVAEQCLHAATQAEQNQQKADETISSCISEERQLGLSLQQFLRNGDPGLLATQVQFTPDKAHVPGSSNDALDARQTITNASDDPVHSILAMNKHIEVILGELKSIAGSPVEEDLHELQGKIDAVSRKMALARIIEQDI